MSIKKISKICLWYFVFMMLVLRISYAFPYIDITDNWAADEGTTTDKGIFTSYTILTETLGITDMNADMICYDWNDDGRYDNCYWDSNGCGGSCNANSCDYFAEPHNMPDSWKGGCDIDAGQGLDYTLVLITL